MISIADAVADLYSGEPGDFVARRRSWVTRAKDDGAADVARAVAALRKPTLAASHVNRLDAASLDAVLALGRELRAAQTRLDADAMKDVTARRQRVLHDIVAALDVSGTVAEDVRATLLAATADTGAADAVASRALVRALHYSGWGDVDLGDAIAHQAAVEAGRACLRLVDGHTPAPSGDDQLDGARDAAAQANPVESRVLGFPTPPDEAPATTGDDVARTAADELIAAERERAEASAERRRREATREIERLEVRLRAAQAAVDAAGAARDAASRALAAARERLASLD